MNQRRSPLPLAAVLAALVEVATEVAQSNVSAHVKIFAFGLQPKNKHSKRNTHEMSK